MNRSRATRAGVPAVALVLAGCASSLVHAPADHCSAVIPAGMARVVASRSGSWAGGAAALGVVDDGQPIAELGPGGRACWLRHAGTAHVTAYVPAQAPHYAREIDIALAPGETALIEIALGEPWKLVRVQR